MYQIASADEIAADIEYRVNSYHWQRFDLNAQGISDGI